MKIFQIKDNLFIKSSKEYNMVNLVTKKTRSIDSTCFSLVEALMELKKEVRGLK